MGANVHLVGLLHYIWSPVVGFVMAGPSFVVRQCGKKIVSDKVNSKILIALSKKFHTFSTKIQFAHRVGREGYTILKVILFKSMLNNISLQNIFSGNIFFFKSAFEIITYQINVSPKKHFK